MKKIFALIALLIIISSKVYTQNTDSLRMRYDYFSQYLSPEKLYLHIDRNIFTPGETIWFKGYLENKSYQSVMPTSNYVYVELLRDSVISRVLLKKSAEGFAGQMVLPDDIAPGEYILRGYTNWNKNMPAEYMFYSKIRIVGSEGISEKEAIRKKADLRIDFYPESGRYFAGMMATIAFKSNYKNLSGYVRNSKGDKVTDFCTEHDGMGRFMFLPEEGERYYAIVTTGGNEDKTFELPGFSAEGGMINIKRNPDAFIIKSYLSHGTASLLLHNGSEIYYCDLVEQGETNQESNIIRIEEKNLSRGINHALLISPNGEILAERLFFVYDKEGVKTDLKFNKDVYGKREKVTVSATLKDLSGNPVVGEFSVSVLDGNFSDFSQEDDIVSYMLISSELKGKINNPDYYFDNSFPLNERQHALDLLMMVQGWKYYDTPYLFSQHPQVKYGKEYTQSISGAVEAWMGRKANGFSINLFAPEIGLSYRKNFDGSVFYIDSLDFPDGISFFLQANSRVGKKRLITNIENDIFAPRFIYNKLYSAPINSISEEGTGRESGTGKLNIFPIIDNDSIKSRQLDEAVVTASAYYRPKHNPSPYGQPFERSNVKVREELKRDDFKEIQDYIVQNYPSFYKMGDVILSRRSGSLKHTSGQTIITHSEPVLYVDGIRWPTKDLVGMNVRDVETLVVLKGNDGVLYKSVWGVILISLRRGDPEIDKQEIKSNGIIIKPLGWQKPTRFYSPVYDTEELYNNPKPDYRTTLYWNPSIKTDKNGVATFEFYTSDYENPFVIRIEGIFSGTVFSNLQIIRSL